MSNVMIKRDGEVIESGKVEGNVEGIEIFGEGNVMKFGENVSGVEVVVVDDLMKLKKEDLIELIEGYEDCLICLEERLGKKFEIKKGRKEEVYELLKNEGRLFVKEISEKLGISSRNVSSQLSYLRKDGIDIATDSKGRKFIDEE